MKNYQPKPYITAIKDLTQKQKFEFLLDNYREIVDIKKSAMKQADNTEYSEPIIVAVNKGLVTHHADDPTTGVIKRTIIGNTYYWLDSHDDVHVDGIFTKSLKEKAPNKIYHYHDHQGMLTSKVGTFSKVYEKRVMWNDLGKNLFGYTTALLGDTEIKRILNKSIFEQYLNEEIDQHSVGMNYITMQLAINSDEPAFKEHKKEWDNIYQFIGNKDKVLEQGFFWSQKEARLIEMSAVGAGSNEVTHTVQNIAPDFQGKQEPSADTPPEPTKVTQKSKTFYMYL